MAGQYNTEGHIHTPATQHLAYPMSRDMPDTNPGSEIADNHIPSAVPRASNQLMAASDTQPDRTDTGIVSAIETSHSNISMAISSTPDPMTTNKSDTIEPVKQSSNIGLSTISATFTEIDLSANSATVTENVNTMNKDADNSMNKDAADVM